MSFLRKSPFSRANGSLSRGPVTREGKQRSCINAIARRSRAIHNELLTGGLDFKTGGDDRARITAFFRQLEPTLLEESGGVTPVMPNEPNPISGHSVG